MNRTKFAVSRFENRNGVVSWRVSGQLYGERVRKNFSTREEAAAEKAALEINAEQATSGLRAVATCLTTEQVRDAEAVIRRLEGKSLTLSFCADYTLKNYRAPECEKTLVDAVIAYLAAKKREQERGIISEVQVGSIKKELTLLQAFFPSMTVAPLTSAKLVEFCERGKPALKTYNNRRGILSTFFKFAFQQDWLAANPIEKIPYHRIAHRRGSAKTLTATQAQDLMAFVESHEAGRLVPFFALCLFAGIRPCVRNGEILKLKPECINLDTSVIHVEPEVSKVRMKRNVAIQPNLAAWLHAYPLDRYPLIPANLQHLRAIVAKRFDLTHDVMRHTFISMFVGKFRSMGEAALQAGNSESIIRKHYLDLKSAEEAEQFFGILPKSSAATVTAALSVTAMAPDSALAQAKHAVACVDDGAGLWTQHRF